MTLGSHQRSIGKSQGHITPRWLLDALTRDRPRFGLDPAAADPRPWDCAAINWTSGSLEREWPRELLIYLNPPFDRRVVGAFVTRAAQHGNAVVLTHARIETEWFLSIWQHAHGILFLADRIKFCLPDGSEHPHNSGAPAVLVAFGEEALSRLRGCGIAGVLVTEWPRPRAPVDDGIPEFLRRNPTHARIPT
jgi:hypothetical protein